MEQVLTRESEAEAWTAWHQEGDQRAREDLVRNYLPLVQFLAAHLSRFVPASYRGDLYGFGVIGLLDAIDKFKPEMGHSFKTYGAVRIRGAMSDGIRKLNWLPRGAQNRASRVIETVVPVDFQTATTPIGVRLQDCLYDPQQESALDGLELKADHAEVVDAVQTLPERERRVIRQYYFERRRLAEIGKEMGVTESRVCQLHRAALVMLRDALIKVRQTA
jgi:RNA polymerase sigma factor FliA